MSNTSSTTNSPLTDRSINERPAMSTESSPAASVEPLHQGSLPSENLEMQRQLLQKKLAEKQEKFASPTDSILSPCTAKLQASKKKQFGKTKPMLLKKAFADVQQENKAAGSAEAKKTDSDSIF